MGFRKHFIVGSLRKMTGEITGEWDAIEGQWLGVIKSLLDGGMGGEMSQSVKCPVQLFNVCRFLPCPPMWISGKISI